MKSRILAGLTAALLVCGLSLTARAQIGTGWTPAFDGFYVQTSAGCTFTPNSTGGGTFSVPSGGKGRAEARGMDLATTGEWQFQGRLVVNSLGGTGINVCQLFGPAPSTPWVIIAIKSGGEVYDVENGNNLGTYTVGVPLQVNTIYNPGAKSVQVYLGGTLVETDTGNGPPNYNKFGAYISDKGSGPCTTTWSNIGYWEQGQTGGYYITDVAPTGANGTVSPAGGFVGPLAAGANQTITIAPDAGYTSQVYVDNVLVGTGLTSYTFSNIQASHMIFVNFIQGTTTNFTITASAGTGGTIAPSGAVTVSAGSNQTFTITPASGNTIASVTVDGSNVGAVSSYTFSNVQANHTISAAFTSGPPPPAFTITASAGSGGSISPSGSVTVNQGASQTFTITANSGFTIQSVTVDGSNVGAVSTYTFSNVQANHTISAAFQQISGNEPAPTFSEPSGTYAKEVHVRVTDSDSSASLYYTTDGSTPTSSSTPVPDRTIEFKSTTTLNAIAIDSGVSSPVASATYTITP